MSKTWPQIVRKGYDVYTAAEIMEVFPKTAVKEMAKARERMAQAEADKPAQEGEARDDHGSCEGIHLMAFQAARDRLRRGRAKPSARRIA